MVNFMDKQDLAEEIFVETVMMRLPPIIEVHVARELHHVARCRYNEGWTVGECVAYMRCLSEVNPELDDEVALKRIQDIRVRYLRRVQAVACGTI
jgi:hypothetical protein